MSTSHTPTQSEGEIPAGVRIYQLAVGHYVSRAMALVTKLGVADQLGDGPRSVESLAEATATHAPALRRVLRLLVSVGLFDERPDGGFGLTELGDLLREGAPGSMKAHISLFAGVGIQDSWRELEHCVRTGEPAFMKDHPDHDPFTEMAMDPEAAANFDKAMATFAPQTAAAIAAAYDFSKFEKLMDVGGGNGSLLIGIATANPELRGIVFDQPHVIERAEKELAQSGLTDRLEGVGGSFFESVPRGADAILLKHVIHDWPDEQARRILEVCRRSLPEDGTLLIVEGLYPDEIDGSLAGRGAAANDVNMLVCTGGRQRSEAEFRSLFESAGFTLRRIVATPVRVAVIEAAPA